MLQYGRELQTQYRSTLELKDQLLIKAPFDGRLTQFQDILKPGLWIEKSMPLVQIVNDVSGQIIAYSDDALLGQFVRGTSAIFYLDEWKKRPFTTTVIRINETNLRVLSKTIHVSSFGGEIAVRPGKDNTLIPEKAIYRINLQAEGDDTANLRRIMISKVSIESKKIAFIERLAKMTLTVVICESRF